MHDVEMWNRNSVFERRDVPTEFGRDGFRREVVALVDGELQGAVEQ